MTDTNENLNDLPTRDETGADVIAAAGLVSAAFRTNTPDAMAHDLTAPHNERSTPIVARLLDLGRRLESHVAADILAERPDATAAERKRKRAAAAQRRERQADKSAEAERLANPIPTLTSVLTDYLKPVGLDRDYNRTLPMYAERVGLGPYELDRAIRAADDDAFVPGRQLTPAALEAALIRRATSGPVANHEARLHRAETAVDHLEQRQAEAARVAADTAHLRVALDQMYGVKPSGRLVIGASGQAKVDQTTTFGDLDAALAEPSGRLVIEVADYDDPRLSRVDRTRWQWRARLGGYVVQVDGQTHDHESADEARAVGAAAVARMRAATADAGDDSSGWT